MDFLADVGHSMDVWSVLASMHACLVACVDVHLDVHVWMFTYACSPVCRMYPVGHLTSVLRNKESEAQVLAFVVMFVFLIVSGGGQLTIPRLERLANDPGMISMQ